MYNLKGSKLVNYLKLSIKIVTKLLTKIILKLIRFLLIAVITTLLIIKELLEFIIMGPINLVKKITWRDLLNLFLIYFVVTIIMNPILIAIYLLYVVIVHIDFSSSESTTVDSGSTETSNWI